MSKLMKWIVVVLMLGAMALYVLTLDESEPELPTEVIDSGQVDEP